MKYLLTLCLIFVAGCNAFRPDYSREIRAIDSLPHWQFDHIGEYFTCNGPVFNCYLLGAGLGIEIQQEVFEKPLLFEAHSKGYFTSFSSVLGKLLASEISIDKTPLFSRANVQSDQGYIVTGFIQTDNIRYRYIITSEQAGILNKNVVYKLVEALNCSTK